MHLKRDFGLTKKFLCVYVMSISIMSGLSSLGEGRVHGMVLSHFGLR